MSNRIKVDIALTRQMQINIISSHFTRTRLIKLCSPTVPDNPGCATGELLYTAGVILNWSNYFGKYFGVTYKTARADILPLVHFQGL